MRLQERNKDTWKEKSIFSISIAMTLNFLLFMAILQRNILGYSFYHINISSLSDRYNNLLTILILFFSPCVIVNYLLVFRKKRYEELIKKYPYRNGRLAATYILISMFLPVILLFMGIIIVQDVTFGDFFNNYKP